MRRKYRPSIAVPVVTALTACGDGNSTGPGNRVDNTNFEATENFSSTVTVTTQHSFSLNGINGNVEVVGDFNATEVTITGTKTVKSESVADAEAYLDQVSVAVSNTSAVVLDLSGR